MKHLLMLMMLAALPLLTTGCSEKSTVTSETKIKTPGGETTIKTEKEVKKTGDHKTESNP